MKILVLSDSHSALSFMRLAIDVLKPDVLIHLGDYVHDIEAICEDYPSIPCYNVPGNCDRYRLETSMPEIRVVKIGGVYFYLTHGHRHGVKTCVDLLLRDAGAANVQAVLFGHTHEAYCSREEDGLLVMNPGSCGYYGGSVGLVTIEGGEITDSRILYQRDLEGAK